MHSGTKTVKRTNQYLDLKATPGDGAHFLGGHEPETREAMDKAKTKSYSSAEGQSNKMIPNGRLLYYYSVCCSVTIIEVSSCRRWEQIKTPENGQCADSETLKHILNGLSSSNPFVQDSY